MEEMLFDQNYRRKIIQEIKSDENIQRKVVSYKKMNMQNDNYYQYVKEYLESKLDAETVQELDIFSNINLQRRVSKSESGIYKNEPQRTFFLNDKALEEMNDVYEDMHINYVLRKTNEAYKYQEQCAIQIYPEDQKLKARVLLPHHYDVIPDYKNPEKAMAYIISNFDNTTRDKIRRESDRTGFSQGDTYRDGVNQSIADWDDPKLKKERYYIWTSRYNFVMNGKGEILDKETEQPIDGFVGEDGSIILDENIISPLFEYDCLPFIDVASNKDFEYWVRSGDSLYDSTIMLNTILTSEFQTVKMQGHAQAYYKGDAEHMPENIRVGVDKMIFIPINPNQPTNAEFGFANPGSDLAGIREFRESFIKSFLSSRGMDVSIITGTGNVNTASSGIEKMFQMIDKFEASLDDFSLFKKVEKQLCSIIMCWIKSLYAERVDGELILGEEYQINVNDPKLVSCNIEFKKPEMIKTDMEVLEVAEKEIDMGVSSRVHYLMEHKNMSLEEAKNHIKEVDEYEQGILLDVSTQTEVLEEGSEPEV